MKKLFCLSLAAIIAISPLSGCGTKEEMVEVNIPASLFMGEELTDEQLQQSIEESGYESYKLNDDGSVTYTMTKAKHQEVLDEYKKMVDETIDSCLTGDDAVASFSNIEYDDGMTEFDIYVDSESYSFLNSISALTFYILGGYYQTFAGVASDDINVIVNFIDKDTNETLDTGSYQDMMKEVNAD